MTEESISYPAKAVVYDPLGDGISQVCLIRSMGSDIDIVNDARVSYARRSLAMTEADEKLIGYLIKHRHTSPLRGVVLKFRVTAPLFIARQWWKHTIASSHANEQIGWNERSFRYTEADPDRYYLPPQFRGQSLDNKQKGDIPLDYEPNELARTIYSRTMDQSFRNYQELLAVGVCREQARAVLGAGVYTEWIWTASLQALLHFCDLRAGDGAQSEITAYANAVLAIAESVCPVAVRHWRNL